MKIGYTTGVYDLFHIGHLNLLRNAKAMCDRLIVGVTTDELVSYKHKKAVIPFSERIEIVRHINCVDCVIPQENIDKFEAWKKLRFDILFVGDDWYNHSKWQEMEQKFRDVGVKIVYFPYTKGTSSTLINKVLMKERKKEDQNLTELKEGISEIHNSEKKYLSIKEEYLNNGNHTNQ